MRPSTAPLAIGFVLAGSACGGAAPASVREVGSPDLYEARVTAARGPVVPRAGDSCLISVEHTTDAVFNCRIRIDCAGDRVYGLAEGGYNRCYEVQGEFVFARDRRGTRLDGDPRLHFDVSGGRIVVSDDAPDIELELDLHPTPAGYEAQVPEV